MCWCWRPCGRWCWFMSMKIHTSSQIRDALCACVCVFRGGNVILGNHQPTWWILSGETHLAVKSIYVYVSRTRLTCINPSTTNCRAGEFTWMRIYMLVYSHPLVDPFKQSSSNRSLSSSSGSARLTRVVINSLQSSMRFAVQKYGYKINEQRETIPEKKTIYGFIDMKS